MSSILGSRVLRTEDPRLLVGAGEYVANLQLAGEPLFACFAISPYPHATFTKIHSDEAVTFPGVSAVLTAWDLEIKPMPGSVPDRPMLARHPLARGRVRYVGEPYALVLARDQMAAEDGAEAIWADFSEQEAVVDPLEALEGRISLFDGDSNIYSEVKGEDDPDLFAGCEIVVTKRFINQRLAPASLEARAIAAIPDSDGRLIIYASTQSSHGLRNAIARSLGLDNAQVVVRARDVGGGFGAKISAYPEEIVIAAAARRLQRPIKWVEDRGRSMVNMVHGRGQIQDVTLGGTREGVLRALRLEVTQDAGAYPLFGVHLPALTTLMASGTYRIPRVETSYTSVATNTTPVAAYRGAGRPEAAAAIERVIDLFAATAGIDPVEIRMKNFIAREEFPYRTPTGAKYDVGDYASALRRVLEAGGYDRLRDEQGRRRARNSPLQLGIGIAAYVEITNGGASGEYGRVEIAGDGRVRVYSGTAPHGQGHATAWAMLASQHLGIGMDRIEVVTGDTELIPRGVGTFGSRSLQTGGVAIFEAAAEVASRARRAAASLLEAASEDIVLGDEGAWVAGSRGMGCEWARIVEGAAEAAEPLDFEVDFKPNEASFPFGCHLALVEVDVETGGVKLVDFIALDDAGKIINPLLAEGQVHGGIAQGVAQALLEEFSYSDRGLPLTQTFTDYEVISAAELPSFQLIHQETPTYLNPLGAKGIGESGTIGATPAVWNAVMDALSHLGVRHINLPLTPERIYRSLENSGSPG